MLATAVINPLAIVLAGMTAMPIGMVWYGPLFGKQWAKLMGFTEKGMQEGRKNMGLTYGAQLASSVVQAFVLSLMIYASQVTELGQIVLLSFWLWLGFMATVLLTKHLFNMRPFILRLYLIDAFYHLAVVTAMGMVISLFV